MILPKSASWRDAIKAKMDLTPRELDVVDEICKGLSNKEVGSNLFLSEKGVKWHVTNILRKVNCKNRKELKRLIDKLCK